ncbi:MAG: hypothetical protein PUB51_00135, partial [Oscillospiraceae bacterium]|nr:hypothetical protein [Oscillospiraceae bacterium]
KGMEGIEVDGEQGLNTVGDYQILIRLKNYKYVPSGASEPTSDIYLNLRVVNKVEFELEQVVDGVLSVEIATSGAYEIPSVGSSVKSVTITTADGQSDGIRYMPGASIWLPAGNYEFRFNY